MHQVNGADEQTRYVDQQETARTPTSAAHSRQS
jgi:hypothetical protein